MNKLLSLVLSVCLLFSSVGPVAAVEAKEPVANYTDEELIRLVMEYYDVLSSENDGPAENAKRSMTVEEDYQKFRVEYLRQLDEQCQGVNAKSEEGVQCANAKKEVNIREAHQIAVREIKPNVVLQQVSAELLEKLKENPALALRFQKDGEHLNPYLQIFPLFYLAQGLDEQTHVGVEDVLQKQVLAGVKKCADEDDTGCPLSEATILAMLSNRSADAEAVAEVLKKGYNHPQLGGMIVSNLGPALLAMCSDMKNYQIFSDTIVNIINNSESGNYTWGWDDSLSVQGWANLVDHWFINTGVFAEGFQNGFYKPEEDKEFSNFFSAWGDLGQELGFLAKKDSNAATAAGKIVDAARQAGKNHLLVLGMMAQGYYPKGSADWLKEMAANGMGDLEVPTRLYVREGIYDAYIGLGKTKEDAHNDLHIYERGTLEYNEYMVDAYNAGVLAESLKMAGIIIDAALLVYGVVSLASVGNLVRELWTLYRWRAPLKALVVIGKSIKSAGLGKAAYWTGKLGKFSKNMRFAELGLRMRQEILADAIASIMTKREAFTALEGVNNVVREGKVLVRETADGGVQLARRSGNTEQILNIPKKYRNSSIEDLEKGAAHYRRQAKAAEKAGDFAEANRLQREATEMERLAKQADDFGFDGGEHFVQPTPSPTTTKSPSSGLGIDEEAVEQQVNAATDAAGATSTSTKTVDERIDALFPKGGVGKRVTEGLRNNEHILAALERAEGTDKDSILKLLSAGSDDGIAKVNNLLGLRSGVSLEVDARTLKFLSKDSNGQKLLKMLRDKGKISEKAYAQISSSAEEYIGIWITQNPEGMRGLSQAQKFLAQGENSKYVQQFLSSPYGNTLFVQTPGAVATDVGRVPNAQQASKIFIDQPKRVLGKDPWYAKESPNVPGFPRYHVVDSGNGFAKVVSEREYMSKLASMKIKAENVDGLEVMIWEKAFSANSGRAKDIAQVLKKLGIKPSEVKDIHLRVGFHEVNGSHVHTVVELEGDRIFTYTQDISFSNKISGAADVMKEDMVLKGNVYSRSGKRLPAEGKRDFMNRLKSSM